jgi:hypothetical protein
MLSTDKKLPALLLLSVFVVATCGLIYELIAGTLASYLLGDSVNQFLTIIGVYLFSMVIGSWISKHFEKNILSWFIQIEILVGIVGGASATILFLVFESIASFRMVLYGLVSLTGILVGLEIPENNAVLTWPEGNGWIMKKLASTSLRNISQGSLCYRLEFTADDKVSASILHTKTGKITRIIAEKVILATPQFVNQKLLAGIKRPLPSYEAFNYSPWFIANVTVNQIPTAKGQGLSWDNVAYGTPSVGYVNASQQHLAYSDNKKVITYYLPLCDYESRVARLAAYSRTPQQWLEIVMPELEFMHPGITPFVETMDAWIWGHGMIAPQVDFVWGDARKQAAEPIDRKIFFAHTDLSGISIFEEAFHQGINAAKAVIASYGNA